MRIRIILVLMALILIVVFFGGCESDPEKEKLHGEWYDEYGLVSMEFGESGFLSGDKCIVTIYYTKDKITKEKLNYEYNDGQLLLKNKGASVSFPVSLNEDEDEAVSFVYQLSEFPLTFTKEYTSRKNFMAYYTEYTLAYTFAKMNNATEKAFGKDLGAEDILEEISAELKAEHILYLLDVYYEMLGDLGCVNEEDKLTNRSE